MVEQRPIKFSRTAKGITVAIIVFLAIVLLRSVTHILLPFIWAVIIAYIFNPLITRLTRRTRFKRGIWVLAVYIVMIGTMALLITALVPVLYNQYNGLVEAINKPGGFIDKASEFASKNESFELGMGIKLNLRELEQEGINKLKSLATEIPASVPDIFVTIIEGFIHLLVFLVTTFYLLLQTERIMAAFYGLVPAEHRSEIKGLVGNIDRVLGAYIRGQLILIAIMTAASFVALTILQVRFALIIAIATGVLEIIPFVGPYLATGIAATVALLQGSTPFGWQPWVLCLVVIGVYFALRQLEDQLVIPALVGHIVDLHPILVLFAILAGGVLGGGLGLLVAIPVAAVIKILLSYLYSKLVDAPFLVAPDHAEKGDHGRSSSVEPTATTTATS